MGKCAICGGDGAYLECVDLPAGSLQCDACCEDEAWAVGESEEWESNQDHPGDW